MVGGVKRGEVWCGGDSGEDVESGEGKWGEVWRKCGLVCGVESCSHGCSYAILLPTYSFVQFLVMESPWVVTYPDKQTSA